MAFQNRNRVRPKVTAELKGDGQKSVAKRPVKFEGPEEVSFDEDRLRAAKECESRGEDARLAWEEAKAKFGLARAEHRLLIARRNRLIAKTDEPELVEDAQREVLNARARMSKANTAAVAAKDEFKGCEEALAKALTEKLPLFD